MPKKFAYDGSKRGGEAIGSPRRPAYDPVKTILAWEQLSTAVLGTDGSTDLVGALGGDVLVVRICTP